MVTELMEVEDMAERESAAERSQRAVPRKKSTGRVTDEFVQKGKANLAKGRAKREAMAQKAREEGRESATVRWARLIDGTLTVQELDDDELERMRVRSKDGSFAGPRQPIPSHIAAAMHRELMARATDEMRMAIPKAARVLSQMLDDPEAKHADQIKAANILLDRVMGRAPETIRIEGADKFGSLLDDAFGAVDRDLDVPTE